LSLVDCVCRFVLMEVCLFDREPSISRSYEGSDIVYEDLLGAFSNNLKCNPGINNGNTAAAAQSKAVTPNGDLMEDIFGDDLFDIDKQSNYLLTDAEEEEEESVEGADPTSTLTQPKVDVFDCILMDLDEKTKEMEKQLEAKNKTKLSSCKVELQQVKTRKKKTATKREKKCKHRKRMDMHGKPSAKHGKQLAASKASLDECKEPLEALKLRFKVTDDDKRMLHCAHHHHSNDAVNMVLNPWILRKWEYKNNHKRRSLRMLLSTLNDSILWTSILEEEKNAGFIPCTLKDIIYDDDCLNVYHHAMCIFNADKSVRRGDNIQQQIICAWIHDALQSAYHQMVHAKTK